jgi:hypothetical protein
MRAGAIKLTARTYDMATQDAISNEIPESDPALREGEIYADPFT